MDRGGKYKEQNKLYYLRHKEKILEKRKQNYNPKEKKEYNNSYYISNKEKIQKQKQDYYKRTRDKRIILRREYYQLHKEDMYNRTLKYRATPKGRMICRLSTQRRRKLIKDTDDGTITLEYIDFLYKKQDAKCSCCGLSLEEDGFHIDHIKPLCKGGCHTASNIQLLYPSCNLHKGSKYDE